MFTVISIKQHITVNILYTVNWLFYRFDLLLPRTALKSSSISTALDKHRQINIHQNV